MKPDHIPISGNEAQEGERPSLASDFPPHLIYLIVATIGMFLLSVLTPPFQVPDEQQHFYRAYQLSELSLLGVARDGSAGAILPSSLPELADRFLGRRAILADRPVRPSPFRDTVGALAVPLDPVRREFVDFTGAAFYSPLPYVPQIVAIAVGRAAGLGPLGLLYAVRLANGLAAVVMVTVALSLIPVGAMMLLVVALLPMVLFEFASASPDAAVIGAAFLFTAIAMRARFRGRWHGMDILIACICGAMFCSLKPVYAPLLVMGMWGVFRRGSTAHVVGVHAVLIGVAMGSTAMWFTYSASLVVLPRAGTSLSGQLSAIMAHPDFFVGSVLNSIWLRGAVWFRGTIGILGWLTIQLPAPMYVLPIIAGLGCVLQPRPTLPSIGGAEFAWQTLLLGSTGLLVLMALYLFWTPVGAGVIEGVQGRYFLPLGGLATVVLSAVIPPSRRPYSPLIRSAVLLLVIIEVVLTPLAIVQSYQEF
jgi:Predicted membrane protein (DUF2142)